MTTKSTSSVARQLAESHGRGDVQAVRELLSPKLSWQMPGVPKPMGRDDYLEGMKAGLRAFSDQSIAIEDEVVQGDKVVHRYRIDMRHTGEFQGIPATNRSVTFSSVWFYRVVDNQVVEAWSLDQDFLKELR